MAKRTFDDEYRDAVQAAAAADAIQARAKSARYDRRSRRVVVDLRNGARFLFPPDLLQGLAGASHEDLKNVHVSASGAGLHWPSLDADFSLPALMSGIFGSKKWMAELAKRGGSGTRKATPVVARVGGRKVDRQQKDRTA